MLIGAFIVSGRDTVVVMLLDWPFGIKPPESFSKTISTEVCIPFVTGMFFTSSPLLPYLRIQNC